MFTLLNLKSLEIQGFKSFPALTRLTFDKPITAVVGPNGSGKSNIADALLWVMGEQSTKTLRGGKMEDVIFGGTLRRPQQNFAEVSLILDNSEGDLDIDTTEVMITRRYYRSGESEYYINRESVRLKEITEILMDTGLGREGYSVIGQGRISEIISAKSKDRRDIFEEAAGISRYRHKKEEAERKLQGTEENLVRISDKISELELQVGPLREQAATAKKYNSLISELKGVEIALWLKDIESIEARTEKAEKDHLDAQREADAADIEYDEIFTQQESLIEMTVASDKEAQAIRDEISETEREKSSAQQDIAVYRSKLESNANQIENIKTGLKSHEEQHDGVGAQISDSEKRLNEIASQKDAKDKQIDTLEKELEDAIGTSDRCEETHRELITREQKLQTEYSEKKSELSALAAGAQELLDSEESFKQKLADAKEDLKTREGDYKQEKAAFDKASEEVTSLENVISGLKLKLDGRVKKAEASGETFERLSSELNTMQQRHSLLTDMDKEYQGYYKSVQVIMQEHSRGTLKNIHGTIAGLMKTDDIYTVAIETALGNSGLQNIIVDTEEDVKAGINLLKRRNAGRATFQPISSVKGTALNESEFKNDAGFIGLAINLVKFDKKYTGIYTYLLGRVIICENIDDAIKMSRKYNQRYKIVTLDGQIMNAGGSVTGGSTVSGAGVGMLSRANEIAQLAKRIEACKENLEKAEREHNERVRERTAAEYEYETAQDEIRIARENVKMHELELSHREQNLTNANILIDTLTSEITSFNKKIRNNTTETETLKSRISELEKELTAIKLEIDEAIKGNEFVKDERERITDARSELRAEIAALEAEKDAIEKSLVNLRSMREEMSDNRTVQLDTISKLESENEKICTDIAQKEREAEELLTKLNSQKERLTAIETGKLDIEQKNTELRASIKAKSDNKDKKHSKLATLDVKLEAIKGEETLILDKLMSKYELGPSAAKNYAAPIESAATAKKRVNVINREIEGLGTVNIGAIAEYERVSERYDYLTTQRDDVQNAKAELLEIIEEVTEKMRGIFTHEFEVINDSFKRTFKQLFGGGRASLILEDPEDVLNCGIEIEVQPPGKALKTISLLSGGEKAFVAIAIYFAIMAVRPPPFVIMDEIDTALDEANVVRFSDYMRYMSDKTQMIVITHKRGTMEEADVLYGITMQELGVSSLICIDLDEAEKHISSRVSA